MLVEKVPKGGMVMSSYFDLLARHLIAEKAFLPVSTERFNEVLATEEILLGRMHWSHWQFVRLIRADQITISTVEAILKQDVESFQELQFETKSNGVTGITVLVFHQGISQETRTKIMSLQRKAFWQNNYSLVWIVDLATSEVWKHQGTPWWVFLSPELLKSCFSPSAERIDDDAEDQHGRVDKFFDDQQKPKVTIAILLVNGLVFLLMTLWGWIFGGADGSQQLSRSENSEILILFGAKYTPYIKAGEYWRLFTSMFIHIGSLHLIFNSYALYQLGKGVEYLFGSAKYAIIYVLSGLAGSIASFVFSPHLSAGASGAIFGLFGALLYFGRREPHIFSQGLGGGIIAALAVNLAFGFMNPGIDNYAHVGGLLGGYLVSNAVGLKEDNSWEVNKLGQLLLIIVLLLVFFWYGLQRGGVLHHV